MLTVFDPLLVNHSRDAYLLDKKMYDYFRSYVVFFNLHCLVFSIQIFEVLIYVKLNFFRSILLKNMLSKDLFI